MEKRQKDISQNRWLRLLKRSSFKSSVVEAGVGFDFTPPCSPVGKRHLFRWRSDRRTSVKTGGCTLLEGKAKKKSSAVEAAVCLDFTPPCGPLGKGHLLRWRRDRRKSVKTGGCTLLEGEATQVLQSKLVWAWTLLPLRPSRKRAPLQMEKRQKDISQNRWLPLLRGRSHKSSSVETGVWLNFPRPGGPVGKEYPLGGR